MNAHHISMLRWNGPSQAFQPQTKTDSSNQQMELEMETFLQRDQPRENGQANEYTVIPLEEFPEENSSHWSPEGDPGGSTLITQPQN